MAIKLIPVKCPQCGAVIDVEEGRKQLFCSYCGVSVLVDNNNEHIIRHIDEASIKQSEVEAMIRLKELELKEKENERKRKGRQTAYIVAGLLFLVGIISEVIVLYNPIGILLIVVSADIALIA